MRFRRGKARQVPGEWLLPEEPHAVGEVEAGEIALQEISRGWNKKNGELTLDPDGPSENDEVYVFDYGSREFFAGDMSKALVGYPLPIVRKSDGAITWYLPGPPPLSDFDEKFPNLRRVRD